MKKLAMILAMLLSVLILFTACDKKEKSADDTKTTEQTEVNSQDTKTPEQLQKEQEEARAQAIEEMSKITLDETAVTEVVEKYESWIEVSRSFQQQIAQLEQSGKAYGIETIKGIDGYSDELKKAGIDYEKFFPILQKVFTGHMFLKSKDMYEAQKEMIEQQMADWQKQLEDVNTPEAQKAQLEQTIKNTKEQIEMLQKTPDGFTEAEVTLLRKYMPKIDEVNSRIQQKEQEIRAKQMQAQQQAMQQQQAAQQAN